MANKILIFADSARPTLHKHKFRWFGVQRDIIVVDPDALVHRICLEQIPIGQKSWPSMSLHVRSVFNSGFVNRAERILSGEFADLSEDGQMRGFKGEGMIRPSGPPVRHFSPLSSQRAKTQKTSITIIFYSS